MIVKFYGLKYDCVKAVRDGNKAVLYLSNGEIAKFFGVSAGAWGNFEFENGDWENAVLPKTIDERVENLETEKADRADVDELNEALNMILTGYTGEEGSDETGTA